MTTSKGIPSISVSYARTRRTIRSNELGMRLMQERAWEKHGAESSEDWGGAGALGGHPDIPVHRVTRCAGWPRTSDKGCSVPSGSSAWETSA